MNIEDLFKTLSYGEFSNLNLGIEGGGNIIVEKQPTVIQYANEALLSLYSRFILKEKDFLLEQVDHITNYHLLEKFSESRAPQPGVPYPYIKDLDREQFVEDIIKILAVYEGSGHELPLNDSERYDSVFTPQQTILQIPTARNGVSLGVLYQAEHPELTLDDLSQEIELPKVLRRAFTAYIAYLAYNHMNTQESVARSEGYLMKYEAICQEAIDRDLVNSSVSTTNSRFNKRGWK